MIEATGCSEVEASEALSQCDNHCKTAILMVLSGLDAQSAKAKLAQHNGFIRNALSDQ